MALPLTLIALIIIIVWLNVHLIGSRKCFYDSYHIAVNSFVKVLIKKTSLEGSLEEVRYAQVLLLYKNSKLLNSNRAVVQWYKR